MTTPFDTIRDAIFGNPPTSGFKPSREGVVKAFEELNDTLNSIVAAVQSLAPYDHIVNITKANTDISGAPFIALYVGAPGSVSLKLSNDTFSTYPDCFAGQVIENVSFKQVRSTGTTAGEFVAMRRDQLPALPTVSNIADVAPADIDLPDGDALLLFVGGEAVSAPGNVSVRTIDNSEALFKNVPASTRLPVRTRQVKAATTSTAIKAVY